MLSFIKGTLADRSEEGIVVENGQIGYEVKVPGSVLSELPAIGQEIRIHTYLYVREDILALYGFLSKDDLTIFKQLITVNGIGPKGALGILSVITPDDLRFAILAEDTKTIAKAPGIGAKTAKKLILELKDKIQLADAFELKSSSIEMGSLAEADDRQLQREVTEALTALGYSGAEAMKAVKQVELTQDMTVEDLLKLSLKKISSV